MAEELTATLSTTHGKIVIRLFPDRTPKTVRNFIDLAEGTRDGINPKTGKPEVVSFYDGTVFHRVIDGFMIQGGDPTGTGMGGPGYEFEDEIHPDLVFDRPYLLAMANAGPGTNGCQFFITVGTPSHLTGKHTIFGEVVEGQDVVDKIAKVPADTDDRPLDDVVVESVVIGR